MLITLKSGYDKYGQATNELDPGVQSFLFRMFAVNIMTIKEAKNSKQVQDYIAEKILEVNGKVQTRVHTIKKWVVLDKEFTVDNGELATTLKTKRKVIEKMYKNEIEGMYQAMAKL